MQNHENDPVRDDAMEPEAAEGAQGARQDDPARATSEAVPDDVARQLDEQRDKYLRLAAEYDNYRRRTAKERAELVPRAQADIVRELIDPLDDLERFAHLDPAQVDPRTLVEGVKIVERKLLKVLEKFGVTQINPVGEVFDPNLHEAVTTEPASHPEEDGVVSRVFQVGYLANGQLLRPARVVVKQWNG